MAEQLFHSQLFFLAADLEHTTIFQLLFNCLSSVMSIEASLNLLSRNCLQSWGSLISCGQFIITTAYDGFMLCELSVAEVTIVCSSSQLYDALLVKVFNPPLARSSSWLRSVYGSFEGDFW